MDASWLTASSATSATDARFGFDTPANSLETGAGLQKVYALLRKTAGAPIPTIDLALWEAGGAISTLLTGTAITSTLGQIVEASFNASLLADPTGAGVEVRIVSTAGTTPGALAAYSAAGTALSSTSTGANSVSLPATPSGSLMILVAHARSSNSDGTITGFDGVNGWAQLGGDGATYGGSQISRIAIGYKVSTGGTDTINVTFGGTGTVRFQARIYKFTAADGFAATPIADVTTPATGTSTTISMPAVTPGGGALNRLAIAVLASSISNNTVSATGESGGDWTQVVAETSVTNGTIEVQSSNQSTGVGVTGGTVTISSANWVSLGFTIVPATINVNTVEIGAVEWVATVSAGTTQLLDTGALAVAGGDLTAAVAVTLDAGAFTLAGSDLIAAVKPLLDTGAITTAGNDLTAAVAVTLDTGAIATAGSDLAVYVASSVTLDTGVLTVAGGDLAAAASVLLDNANVALAGADITILTASSVTLDVGTLTVAGSDLAVYVASSVILDSGAVTVAGSDIAAATSVILDGADIALAGADITVLAAGAVTLDSGAITATGADLAAVVVVTLDTGAVTVAGSDLAVYVASIVTLDTGAVTVAGAELLASISVLLDDGAIVAVGGNITPLGAGAILLDNGAIALTGVDLTAAVAVTLDTGAAALIGSDLIPGSSFALDTGAIAFAGSDLSAAVSVTLDTAAVTVVGGDVTPLSAGAILLDSGAVAIVGADLTTALLVQLDTASVAVAGADLAVFAAGALTLDAGAVAFAGSDLTIKTTVALDAAAATLEGIDLGFKTAVPLASGDFLLIGTNLTIFTGAAPVYVDDTAVLIDLANGDAVLTDLAASDAVLMDLYAPASIIGAAPVFASAGAGVASNAQFGSIAPLAPSTSAEDLLLWVGVVLDSSFSSTVAAPSGFTALPGSPYGVNATAYGPRVHLFKKTANGTEGGNPQSSSFALASGNSVLRSVNARVFKITAPDGIGGIEAIAIIEGVTSAGDATLHCPTVEPDGINRLGILINVVGSAGGVISDATGEMGGDWTQATTAYVNTLGGDCTIDLQTAALTSGATISGGTVPYGAIGAPWISIGLAIVPHLLRLEGQQMTVGLVMDAEI